MNYEFTLQSEFLDEQRNTVFQLKIQTETWEMNIMMNKKELEQIKEVYSARWGNRTCLKIGSCAGAATFWSCEEDGLSILVGSDDECWDFGVLVPKSEIDNIIAEVERQK